MTTISIIEKRTRRVVVARKPIAEALVALNADPQYTGKSADYSVVVHYSDRQPQQKKNEPRYQQ